MSVVLSERDYAQICQLVYQHSRIHLGDNKRELVTARLGKRLRATGLTGYREYCDFLRSPKGEQEISSLVDVISTNHTYFFRESKHFDFLQQTVLPGFLTDSWARGETCLRCWSAASSSGEEPYSLAMTFARHAEAIPSFLWELDASDISTHVLQKARDGIYPTERLTDIPREVIRKHFQQGVGTNRGLVRVRPELRNRIRWHRVNLFQNSYPFPQPFHVIFCRNVMIYFDRPSQEQLVARLARQLVPGGYLMIGHSESISGWAHGLQSVRPAIYRKPLP